MVTHRGWARQKRITICFTRRRLRFSWMCRPGESKNTLILESWNCVWVGEMADTTVASRPICLPGTVTRTCKDYVSTASILSERSERRIRTTCARRGFVPGVYVDRSSAQRHAAQLRVRAYFQAFLLCTHQKWKVHRPLQQACQAVNVVSGGRVRWEMT